MLTKKKNIYIYEWRKSLFNNPTTETWVISFVIENTDSGDIWKVIGPTFRLLHLSSDSSQAGWRGGCGLFKPPVSDSEATFIKYNPGLDLKYNFQSVSGGRRPDDGQRTRGEHANSMQSSRRAWILFPWGKSANHHTTVSSWQTSPQFPASSSSSFLLQILLQAARNRRPFLLSSQLKIL